MARQGVAMNKRHQAGMSMWTMALIALVAVWLGVGSYPMIKLKF